MLTEKKRMLNQEFISIGSIKVNFKNYQALEGTDEIKMSHKEFEVLHFLYKNAGKTIHRDDHYEYMYGVLIMILPPGRWIILF